MNKHIKKIIISVLIWIAATLVLYGLSALLQQDAVVFLKGGGSLITSTILTTLAFGVAYALPHILIREVRESTKELLLEFAAQTSIISTLAVLGWITVAFIVLGFNPLSASVEITLTADLGQAVKARIVGFIITAIVAGALGTVVGRKIGKPGGVIQPAERVLEEAKGYAALFQEFVKDAKAKGYTREEMKQALIEKGWPEATAEEYLTHFFRANGKQQPKQFTEKEAEALIKKHAPDNSTFQKVWQHAKATQNVALQLAEEITGFGHPVDTNFIKVASLLHDIGRFQYPPGSPKAYRHAFVSAEILRKEGWPEQFARAAERHMGAGITSDEIEAQDLELPHIDFLPETIEEKILCYADKLIFRDRLGSPKDVIEKFKREIPSSAAVERFIALHNEIERLRNGTHFL